jgi:hypothetical protein
VIEALRKMKRPPNKMVSPTSMLKSASAVGSLRRNKE